MHSDVCPCKHGTRVCEGWCRACLVEIYGEEATAEILELEPATWEPHIEDGVVRGAR